MKTCIANLKSAAPYQQSGWIDPDLKGEKETRGAFERRIWPEKAHYDENQEIFIPPMAFKQALDAAAKYLSIQVPGRGKTTYTKHFLSGVLCYKPVMLGLKKDQVVRNEILVNSDGVRGSGKRVMRIFPKIPSWQSDVEFTILDDIITEEVFLRVLKEAGSLIGVGQFRPQNGGYFGRWTVQGFEWIDAAQQAA
jgi:hypothetical protein